MVTIFTLCRIPFIRVSLFVHAHKAALQDIADLYLEEGKAEAKYKKCSISYVNESEVPIIQFYLFGFGLVPASREYGFYYAPDDKPHVYWDLSYELQSQGHNKWSYQMDGDNCGKTKKITDNWYYYSVSF